MKIIFFGQLAEVTGKSEMELNDVADTDALLKKLVTDFPKLKDLKILVSVDRKITKENVKLQNGSEVALLPPFAGG